MPCTGARKTSYLSTAQQAQARPLSTRRCFTICAPVERLPCHTSCSALQLCSFPEAAPHTVGISCLCHCPCKRRAAGSNRPLQQDACCTVLQSPSVMKRPMRHWQLSKQLIGSTKISLAFRPSFGGKAVILRGDFRKILPVLCRINPESTRSYTLHGASFWDSPHLARVSLQGNRRAAGGAEYVAFLQS